MDLVELSTNKDVRLKILKRSGRREEEEGDLYLLDQMQICHVY
jgi:hypothetical protein